ncbi:DUF979 family protein [Sphingomonas sp.]|uniref:5-oxoproline transporter, DUF979 family subunit n=1 Tax=Sphingomonas sp. TaxID=28214 RepID=UPI001D92FCB5|nr:DUF979 family protein [Sphingomonas sp.]MBX9797274.1 DUF979 domain-containing protein [Sphingomonas sp.]
MITLAAVYALAGIYFAGLSGLSLARRRWGNGGFWGLLALSMLAGDRIGDLGNGVLALALVALAALGLVRPPGQGAAPRPAPASARTLFVPALVIPATALAGTALFALNPALVPPKQATLVALAAGVLLALALCYLWLRPRAAEPLSEGLRLIDTIGWAAVLPQMLASLGAVFALAGVGQVVGDLIGQAIPPGSLLGAVIAYGLGMALFTMVMGNAFAAFPVMIAAVGAPLLITRHHGDPAVICAIGMLAGFCGTLMTPMAANFNIVPAALLDLKDRYGVVRAQVATALPLLAVNIALIYWLGFR